MSQQPKARVSGKASAHEVEPHLEGFELALKRALEQASQGERPFAKGRHEIEVRFHATLEVENPGHILDYHVVLETASSPPSS